MEEKKETGIPELGEPWIKAEDVKALEGGEPGFFKTGKDYPFGTPPWKKKVLPPNLGVDGPAINSDEFLTFKKYTGGLKELENVTIECKYEKQPTLADSYVEVETEFGKMIYSYSRTDLEEDEVHLVYKYQKVETPPQPCENEDALPETVSITITEISPINPEHLPTPGPTTGQLFDIVAAQTQVPKDVFEGRPRREVKEEVEQVYIGQETTARYGIEVPIPELISIGCHPINPEDLDLPRPDVLVADGVAIEPCWVKKQRSLETHLKNHPEAAGEIRKNLAEMEKLQKIADQVPKADKPMTPAEWKNQSQVVVDTEKERLRKLLAWEPKPLPKENCPRCGKCLAVEANQVFTGPVKCESCGRVSQPDELITDDDDYEWVV